MSELLVVPLKKSSEVDVVKPLKNLIQSSYSGDDANAVDHSEAINEFSKLRNSAIWKAFEKNEISLETLCGYVFNAKCFFFFVCTLVDYTLTITKCVSTLIVMVV